MTRTPVLLLAAAALLWHGPAMADTITLKLIRGTLANAPDDGAGITQRETGAIKKSGSDTAIGQYAIERRRDSTDNALNVAVTRIALIFARNGGNTTPEIIVLEGAHTFNAGQFKGSVSATSDHYSWARGATAAYTPLDTSGEKLTITGSFTGVTLP